MLPSTESRSPHEDGRKPGALHPDAGRSGLGRHLFVESLAAAQTAGLTNIDASIGANNAPALAYYSAMGFTPYREGHDTIQCRFDV